MASRLALNTARPTLSLRAGLRFQSTTSLALPPSQNSPFPRLPPSILPYQTARLGKNRPTADRTLTGKTHVELADHKDDGHYEFYYRLMLDNKLPFNNRSVLAVLERLVNESLDSGMYDEVTSLSTSQIRLDEDSIYPSIVASSPSSSAPSPSSPSSHKTTDINTATQTIQFCSRILREIVPLDPVYFGKEYDLSYNTEIWNAHYDALLKQSQGVFESELRAVQENADGVSARLKQVLREKVSYQDERVIELSQALKAGVKAIKDVQLARDTREDDIEKERKVKKAELDGNHRAYMKWMNDTILERRAKIKKVEERMRLAEKDLPTLPTPTFLTAASTNGESPRLLHAVETTIEFHKDQMYNQQLEMVNLARKVRKLEESIGRDATFVSAWKLMIGHVAARRTPFTAQGPNTSLFQRVISFVAARQFYKALLATWQPGQPLLASSIAYLDYLLDVVRLEPAYALGPETVLEAVSVLCTSDGGALLSIPHDPSASSSFSQVERAEPLTHFVRTATRVLQLSKAPVSNELAKRVSEEVKNVRESLMKGGSSAEVKQTESGLERLEKEIRRLSK